MREPKRARPCYLTVLACACLAAFICLSSEPGVFLFVQRPAEDPGSDRRFQLPRRPAGEERGEKG